MVSCSLALASYRVHLHYESGKVEGYHKAPPPPAGEPADASRRRRAREIWRFERTERWPGGA
jgi:hypothetical protein